MTLLTRRVLPALASSLVAVQAHAQAPAWPTRTIRLVSPFPPGGAADLLARILAEALTTTLGQSVVVENRTGAGGSVGTEAVVRAPADGYTLVMGSTGPNAINPSLIRLSYDPERDLVPVASVAAVASVLVVNPSVQARTLEDILRLARAEPGKLSYGSSGIGSAQHLFMEQLKQQANVDIVHIPYRGTGPAMVDTVGGRLDMMFDTTPTALPHIRDGRVRPIVVSSAQRDTALPNVPTVAESGLPGYEALGWYGLLAPAATPVAIVDRLNSLVNELLTRPDFVQKLTDQGVTARGGARQEFASLISSDRARWAEVIRRGNIRAE